MAVNSVQHIFLCNNTSQNLDKIEGVQCSPFIMLCLGSIGNDHAMSEPCYKGTILQKNYRKMTIIWSFFINSFVKFHY